MKILQYSTKQDAPNHLFIIVLRYSILKRNSLKSHSGRVSFPAAVFFQESQRPGLALLLTRRPLTAPPSSLPLPASPVPLALSLFVSVGTAAALSGSLLALECMILLVRKCAFPLLPVAT